MTKPCGLKLDETILIEGDEADSFEASIPAFPTPCYFVEDLEEVGCLPDGKGDSFSFLILHPVEPMLILSRLERGSSIIRSHL